MMRKVNSSSIKPFSAERLIPMLLLLVTAVLFVLRLTGPNNLMDNDQERPASYVLDVVNHAQWICQKDYSGYITSKPPLYTWLAATFTFILGKGTISLFTLYLPCFFSVLGTALILFLGAKRFLDWKVAALGAFFFIISPMGMKQIALARTDPLFSFTITLSAFTGYYAWNSGKWWIWIGFWLAAAASGLTKGPLGLLLAGGGFLSFFWNRMASLKQPPFSWNILSGIFLYLTLVGGWFLLAYLNEGQSVYNKIIRSELLNHAVGADYGWVGPGLLKTPAYLLTRFLPWSIPGIWGCIMVFRNPSNNLETRRFEHFLVCWILVGCVVLGMATHQRGDLILPLIPPLSLLSAKVLLVHIPAKLKENPILFLRTLVIFCAAGLSLILFYNRVIFSKQTVTFESRAIEKAASNIKEAGYKLDILRHYQSPFTLQFYLNTMSTELSEDDLADFLTSTEPGILSVSNLDEFKKTLGDTPPPYRVIYKWYLDEKPFLHLIANDAWSSTASTLTTHTRKFNSATLYKD
jgi:4-amino-4-deoxy-L-arabinose transferase-like glycosyltransferase